MTGFAVQDGSFDMWRWSWEIRSVNGRGLDIRARVPDWLDGLEAAVRTAVKAAVARGNVTVSLRLSRDDATQEGAFMAPGLGPALTLVAEAEAAATARGLTLRPSSAAEILGLRGVMDAARPEENAGPLTKAVLAALPEVIEAFNAARAGEGAALHTLLTEHVGRIDALAKKARGLAETRHAAQAEALAAALKRVTDVTDAVEPERLAQELALIAVKSDVTEELDRLAAHVDTARDHLAGSDPKGRKLDFLVQELNREANTLCSKSQSTDLTALGLDLKHVIDQMREQVQNVE
ncbi:MAG: YicC/YloC family endoribonuclease [Pseudomonadota bacterium]